MKRPSSRIELAVTVAAAIAMTGCLGPGTWWLSGQVESGLRNAAESALRGSSISAQVKITGRDVTVVVESPTDLARVREVLAQAPGFARIDVVLAARASVQPPGTAPTALPAPSSIVPGSSPAPRSTDSSQPPPPTPPRAYAVPMVQFEGGSAIVQPSAAGSLDLVVAILASDSSLFVALVGHTDNGKSASERMQLGMERAKAISLALQSRGVAADRITVASMGGLQPIGDNTTIAGQAANRRVEITVQRK